MPLPRFRLRALMIGLAIIALILGAGIELERRRQRTKWQRDMAVFAGYEKENRREAAAWDEAASRNRYPQLAAWERDTARWFRQLADHMAARQAWGRRALSHHWPRPDGELPVIPPKPPTPPLSPFRDGPGPDIPSPLRIGADPGGSTGKP